jgi:CBS domain-containing membrane protein
VPILAGATGSDRARACLGGTVAIAVTGIEGALVHRQAALVPWIVAPMGASAVLLFAVPSSPMAQPWPIIAGNGLSAATGLGVAALLGHGALAAGVAVGAAIGVMSLTRSLHPPGGAAALTGALGGTAVVAAGWWFPVLPVAMNGLVLVAVGWVFHRVSGHAYPHRAVQVAAAIATADEPPSRRIGIGRDDIAYVLERAGDTYDIDAGDLEQLSRAVEARVLARSRPWISCGEVMSKDLIVVDAEDPPDRARRLLLDSGVRLLPVLGETGRVAGGVGLRELSPPGKTVGELMSPALLTTPGQAVSELIVPLSDGHRHAAMVVDDDHVLLGLVTQADLVAAMTRILLDQSDGVDVADPRDRQVAAG